MSFKSFWNTPQFLISLFTIISATSPLAFAFPVPGFTQFTIPISKSPAIQATLRVPKTRTPNQKFPLFLVFGGFESADRVLDLFHSDTPVALASFDYPFTQPREFKLADSYSALPQLKQLFPRTLDGIKTLVTNLIHRPEVDPSKVIIVGASFGSPFAIAAGITGVVLVHGFGKVPQTLEHVILKSWLPKYGWPAHPLAWLLSRAGWAYFNIDSPEMWANQLRDHQKVLFITADHDSFIPRPSSDSLWKAVKESHAKSERIVMDTDHLMPGSDHVIQEIVQKIQLWMAQSLVRS
jgi:dienelactone hydrolase